jgi:hypothetical protein
LWRRSFRHEFSNIGKHCLLTFSLLSIGKAIEGLRMSCILILTLLTANAQGVTGPEVAQLLNRSFQYNTRVCPGINRPFSVAGTGAWKPVRGRVRKHDAVSSQLGAESFVYLRSDLSTRTLDATHGFLFSDGFTAIGQDKDLELLCAYPFKLPLQAAHPEFVGWKVPTAAAMTDPSSCASLGVNDSASWIEHFRQHDWQPAAQCSFSSQEPQTFEASLIAHQGINAAWSAVPPKYRFATGRPAHLANADSGAFL